MVGVRIVDAGLCCGESRRCQRRNEKSTGHQRGKVAVRPNGSIRSDRRMPHPSAQGSSDHQSEERRNRHRKNRENRGERRRLQRDCNKQQDAPSDSRHKCCNSREPDHNKPVAGKHRDAPGGLLGSTENDWGDGTRHPKAGCECQVDHSRPHGCECQPAAGNLWHRISLSLRSDDARRLIGTQTHPTKHGGAGKVQHVVSGVQRKDIEPCPDEEQSNNAKQ